MSPNALAVPVVIFPLGLLSARSRRAGPAIVGAVSAVRVVPSIAVMFLLFPYRKELGALLPFFDRTFALSLIALTLLAGPPVIINTDAGPKAVVAAMLENARGLGMKGFQVFAKVQLPVLAGPRTASVEVLASATLASFVGVGCLGRFITSGLTLLDYRLLLAGAIPVTLLALTVEAVLAGLERLVTLPTGSSTYQHGQDLKSPATKEPVQQSSRVAPSSK